MRKLVIILFVLAIVFVSLAGFVYAQEEQPAQTATCHLDEDCGQPSVSKYCDGLQACTFEVVPACYKYPDTTEGFCTEKKGGTCTPCAYGCENGECIPASVSCTDPDGTNHFLAGKTCVGSQCELDKCEGNTIIEYTCRDNKALVDHTYGCIKGCSEGACLPETTTTEPVTCTQKENTCCKGDRCGTLLACPPNYINVFKGCDSNCIPISTCEPQAAEIKEKVKCIFANSKTEQKCYLSIYNDKFFCSGIESCIMDVNGYRGQDLVWKSTCGGYGYTRVDGINDDIAFECRAQETTPTPVQETNQTSPMTPYIGPSWYSFAYWQCYDKTGEKQGGGTSCKPAEVWKKYAQEFCINHCDTATGKCGVNSIGIYSECSGATIVQPPVCGNHICESGEGEICEVQAVSCEEGKECTASTKKCYTVCVQDCPKGKEGIYVKMEEKFELQVSREAKVKDYQDLVIKFNDLFVPRCAVPVENIEVAETSAVVETYDTMTGGIISGFITENVAIPIESTTEQRCNDAEPYAVLQIKRYKEKEETEVIKIKLGEKKKIFDFTISFLDYNQESKSGTFIISLGSFECPENCICDINGQTKECRRIEKDCPEKEMLCPDGVCREKCEVTKITTECKFGCFYQDKCLPYGLRVNGLYCSINNDMKTQLVEANSACENNFECKSNVCVVGECISEGFMKKILNWFRRLFGAE
ncbi:MAG: hypothetical protein NTU63_00490 [Candidatus Pacearchaeota archaeon]|nr:hypothetical protein [Candidatus Pacearchaeota archaeon]